VRIALLALSLALAATLPAQGFYEPLSVEGDMDGDGAAEQARSVKYVDQREPDFDRVTVNVSDTCASGMVDRRVAGPEDAVGHLKLVSADTQPGREVFIDLRSGASGRVGEARVVALRDPDGDGCGEPRALFAYTRPTRRPRGAEFFGSFAARVRDVDRRRPGREVVLDERFARPGEAGCCASIRKTTWFRYDAGDDRYERYRTRVIRGHSNAP
jgi:hypothetical protein